MGRQDSRARAAMILKKVLPDAAVDAAGSAIPGAGLGLRALLAAIDAVRLAEIIEEAIVQTVLASIELVDDPLVTRAAEISDTGVTTRELSLRQLAGAIRDQTFAPARGDGPMVVYTSNEIARRWSNVSADLENARRTFSAELGGAFLVPKEAAAAVMRMRTQLRTSVLQAQHCSEAASRLAGQDFSGGLSQYVARELKALREASVALMFTLEDILRAHGELVASARSVVPDRIDALFAQPDAAMVAAASAIRAREAARELLDNARQALLDAGDELNGWRARSSLRELEQVDLCVLASATDLRFDDGTEANSWLSLGHTIDSAQVRFEHLTWGAAEGLDEPTSDLRTRLMSAMKTAQGAASNIHSRYWAVDDERRRGKTVPLDVAGVQKERSRFHAAAQAACDAVAELARTVELAEGPATEA